MDIEFRKISLSSVYVNIKDESRLDIDGAVEYGTKVKEFVEDNNISHLVLDFANVTFISSFGLKVVLEIYKAMKEPAVLRISNASETIKNTFQMVGFTTFIDIN